MAAKIVVVANRKGGVGKTTVALAMAEGMAALKNTRVLVVDLDSQYNISELLTAATPEQFRPYERDNTVAELIGAVHKGRRIRVGDYLTHDIVNLKPGAAVSLLAGSDESAQVERDLLAAEGNSFDSVRDIMDGIIEQICSEQRSNYGIILFDCPPGFSMITEAALRQADVIIVPVAPTHLATRGVKRYVDFVESKVGVENAPDKSWVFLNMCNRHKLSVDFENKIKEHARAPNADFRIFKTAYNYKLGFQKATDRRHQVMTRTLGVWRQMFRRKGVSLFVPLWKPVLDEVTSATDELSRIIGLEGPQHDHIRANPHHRKSGGDEARV